MRHIKVMQGLVKDHAEEDRAVDVNDKYRNKPPKVSSNFCSSIKSHPSVPQSQSFDVPRLQKVTRSNRSMNQRNKIRNKSEVKKLKSKTENKFIEAGVQTERVQDIKKLYDNGLIIYPSPCVVKELETGKRKQQSQDHGDNKNRGDELSNQMKNINLDDKDYIKENILALKQKAGKRDVNEDPTKPPANYQKGVLPKYLKDRKEEQGRVQEVDPECPPGHVLLPEEERKETLRVLRQSTCLHLTSFTKFIYVHFFQIAEFSYFKKCKKVAKDIFLDSVIYYIPISAIEMNDQNSKICSMYLVVELQPTILSHSLFFFIH